MDIRSWNKTFVNLVCVWDGAEWKSKERNAENLKYLIVHIGTFFFLPDPSLSFTFLHRNLRKLERSNIFLTSVFSPHNGVMSRVIRRSDNWHTRTKGKDVSAGQGKWSSKYRKIFKNTSSYNRIEQTSGIKPDPVLRNSEGLLNLTL